MNRTQRWKAARRDFIDLNPPTFEGYYYCHYGGRALDYALIDHMNGRAGDLLEDFDNLVYSCDYHNRTKGSMKYDPFMEMLEKNPKLKVCKF